MWISQDWGRRAHGPARLVLLIALPNLHSQIRIANKYLDNRDSVEIVAILKITSISYALSNSA